MSGETEVATPVDAAWEWLASAAVSTSWLSVVVAIAGTLVAAAIGLGQLTPTFRLRKREEWARAALNAADHSRRREALALVHRNATAQVVAAEIVPTRLAVGPILLLPLLMVLAFAHPDAQGVDVKSNLMFTLMAVPTWMAVRPLTHVFVARLLVAERYREGGRITKMPVDQMWKTLTGVPGEWQLAVAGTVLLIYLMSAVKLLWMGTGVGALALVVFTLLGFRALARWFTKHAEAVVRSEIEEDPRGRLLHTAPRSA